MKKINNIKYILLSLIVFGSFANFAHNEYGLIIVRFSMLSLCLALLAESITAKIKLKSYYLFTEAFFLMLFLLGYFFKMQHWPGAGIILIVSALFLTVFYMISGIRMVIKERKNSLTISLLAFCVYFWVALVFAGWLFKLQHYPGGGMLLYVNIVLFSLLIIPVLLKYNYAGKKIWFFTFLKTLKGNIRLLLIVFSVVILYVTLTLADIAPRFYSLAKPPAAEKLRIQAIMGGEKEEETYRKYRNNYLDFLDNRKQAEKKEQ